MIAIVCILLLSLTQSRMPEVTNLYLDHLTMSSSQAIRGPDEGRIRVWNSTYSSYGRGSFSFSLSFRSILEGAPKNWALSLYNFQTGKQSYLSYKTMLLSKSKSYLTLNLVISQEEVKIISLSFSVILITAETSYLTLLSYTNEEIKVQKNETFLKKEVDPSNIKFDAETMDAFILPEWAIVQRQEKALTTQKELNIFNVQLERVNTTLTLSILVIGQFYRIAGIKINVLLVYKQTNASRVAFYEELSSLGINVENKFRYNFGINRASFGSWLDGNCMHSFRGLTILDPGKEEYLSFMFQYNGTQVSNIKCQNCFQVQLATLCLGQCSKDLFFNGTSCLTCQEAIPFCSKCQSAFKCVECAKGKFELSEKKDACGCPAKTFLNETSLSCEDCPFDCQTCNSTGHCQSCSFASDQRQLDKATSRCICMKGFSECGKSKCCNCIQNCASCSWDLSCDFCAQRYILSDSSQKLECKACPFDCLTCDGQGNCLSCSYEQDKREKVVNGAGSRCRPVIGYYQQQRTRNSSKCRKGCKKCVSLDNCTECILSYQLIDHKCVQRRKDCFEYVVLLIIVIASLVAGLLVYFGRYLFKKCNKITNKRNKRQLVEQDMTSQSPRSGTEENLRNTEPSHDKAQEQRNKNSSDVMKPQSQKQIEMVTKNQKKREEVQQKAEESWLMIECSKCDQNQCQFKSACGHVYHLKCILELSKQNSICMNTNCLKPFEEGKHRYCCIKCLQISQPISFDKIKQLGRKQPNRRFCDYCQENAQNQSL